MAKVAIHGSLSSNSLPFGRAGSMVQAGTTLKRKTPSELREEQLKRRARMEVVDESSASLFGSEKNTGEMVHGTKKQEASKNPRYINTRVDEVYPARKSSNRLTLLYGKENSKDKFPSDPNVSLNNSSAACKFDTSSRPKPACPESLPASVASAKDSMAQTCSMTEKCSHSTFRSVAELSVGSEKASGSVFDMAALKTLGAREAPANFRLSTDSSERFNDLSSAYGGNFSSEFHIPGHKTPLDLTLKTSMRLVSSSSVNWCHRLNASSNCNSVTQFASQFAYFLNKSTSALGVKSTIAVLFSKSLHSWVYPQSSLPASVISALTMSAGQGEMDFLSKRQHAWEDSFRSIYFMLRKNLCSIFYVCTSQFVVMFTGGDCVGKTKRTCNAYVSQSTRGLRSLLREHEISFSMPLCHSEAELATAEDIVELSEIEKRSLGQTRRVASISDVDNSPRSLLAFSGNENVHGLYDFLLNYRSILNALVGVDVPVLCAPVPFENASLSAPEVKCKEMKRANSPPCVLKGPNFEDSEPADVCYSIEIKDTFLPPWIICGICSSMGSEGRSFDASFTCDPISMGLNIAVDSICQKSDTNIDKDKGLQESNESESFGVPEAVGAHWLREGCLRALKYSNGCYTACVSPI